MNHLLTFISIFSVILVIYYLSIFQRQDLTTRKSLLIHCIYHKRIYFLSVFIINQRDRQRLW